MTVNGLPGLDQKGLPERFFSFLCLLVSVY